MSEKFKEEEIGRRQRELDQTRIDLEKTRLILANTERLAGLGSWEWDITNDIWSMSENWLCIHGGVNQYLSTAELILLTHPEDRLKVQEGFNRAVAYGEPYRVTFRIIRQDTGEVRFLAAHGEVQLDSSGKAVRMLGTVQDITEKIRNEEVLEKCKIDLRLVERLAGIGNWSFDPEVGEPIWSEEVYRIYERDPELGPCHLEDYRKMYNGEWWEIYSSAMQDAVRKGMPFDIELKLDLSSGAVKWIHVMCEPDMEKGPCGHRLHGTDQDITARKQAELALLDSGKKWRNILVNTPQVGISLNPQGQIVFANEHFLQMTGWQEDQVKGQDWFDMFIPENIREKLRDIFSFTMSRKDTSKFSNYENEIVTKKGELRVIAWSNVLSTDARGNPVEVTCLGIDLTERKWAENSLRASHERFLTVLDGIDSIIYVADMENHEFLFVNKFMVECFGRDMTGEKCWNVFGGNAENCAQSRINSRIVDEKGKPTGVYVWHDRNPVTGRWYINHDRAIVWIDGRVVRLQIATDITEFKRMEEELRQAHKMEAIGTLAGGIAHDFNNILGIFLGNAELAFDDIPEWNPARSNLNEIRTASLRAKGVVRQLLSFSRKSEQHRRIIDIAPVVHEALQLIRATVPTTIEIRANITDQHHLIKADPTQIQQVIINLCTNATQAMEPDGGILEIILTPVELDEKNWGVNNGRVKGQYLQLTVSDTGAGMDPEIVDRIFDPYFTTKDVGKGSGMGLAIVHGIIKGHDGEISVTSEPERGTTFNIVFPLCRDEDIKVKTHLDDAISMQARGERVLFVDDETAIVRMAGKMLKRLGYSVELATDPREALELFNSNPDAFDMVISDMTMPQMTGIKLASMLKEVRPDIPVIILTGHSPLMDEERAEEIGIAAYIMKPIEKKDISLAIRKVFDKDKSDR